MQRPPTCMSSQFRIAYEATLSRTTLLPEQPCHTCITLGTLSLAHLSAMVPGRRRYFLLPSGPCFVGFFLAESRDGCDCLRTLGGLGANSSLGDLTPTFLRAVCFCRAMPARHEAKARVACPAGCLRQTSHRLS
jgi:hypothetical protein